jgi:hypothetical protein
VEAALVTPPPKPLSPKDHVTSLSCKQGKQSEEVTKMANFPIGGQAELGMTSCHHCGGSGRRTSKQVPCERDDMRRKRNYKQFGGHFKRCPKCHGYAFYNVPCDEPCEYCEGTGQVPEDLYDWFDLPEDMPVEVVVVQRGQTRVESLLGCALGACVDYGASYGGLMSESTHEATVESIVQDVRGRHQGVHFCTTDGRVADGVVVVVNRGGYSAMPKYILPDGRVAYVTRCCTSDRLPDFATDPDTAVLLHAGVWETFWQG